MNKGIAKGVSFDDIHSFYDLNLIFAGAEIPPATPKENYIDVPGADSSLDFTEALGEVKFNDRSGCKFTFTMNPEGDLSDEAFEAKKTEISNLLNGTVRKITLDKDPDYYYYGRCTVNGYAQNKKIKQFVISAKVKPYKYKQKETVFSVDLSKKASASGEIISVNDISPIEHELKVTLTSNTITDFSGVKVSRYGKNLFPIEEDKVLETIGSFTFDAEGIYGSHGDGACNYVMFSTKYPSGTYSFSAEFSHKSDGSNGRSRILARCFDAEGNVITSGLSDYIDFYKAFIISLDDVVTFTIPDTVAYWCLGWVAMAEAVDNPSSMKFPQLELGDTVTPYEVCVEQTATANTDGMVAGLTSISPNMILFADTECVTINCEYEKIFTLKNGRKSVVPVITCTDDNTKVKFGDFETVLNAGTHKVLNICLKQGNNEFGLSGTGKITFTYQEGDM